VYWQLTALGAKCEVVAADALKLARNYRAGGLTAVWVPMRPMRPCEIWYEPGLQALRGIAQVAAVTIVAELGAEDNRVELSHES
jgi:hypothetical protein